MDHEPGGPYPLLDNDLLRTFVAISDTGSFTRAAQRIHRTTSAVSMQVKRLEETLGRTLFLREGRVVTLTPDGEALLSYGRRMLRINQEAMSRFLAPAVDGRVRFGAPDDFGTRFLPTILARFAAIYPTVEVDVVLAPSVSLMSQLDSGNLDLTLITAGSAEARPEQGVIVYTERLVWAGLNGGRAREEDPVRLALAGLGCPWRGTALAALDAAGKSYRIAYNSEHVQAQLAAVLADLAIAPLPYSYITSPVALVEPRCGLPELGNYHILMIKGAEMGPAAEALAEQVTAALAIGMRATSPRE